jgi:hypothetical protein
MTQRPEYQWDNIAKKMTTYLQSIWGELWTHKNLKKILLINLMQWLTKSATLKVNW